MKSDLILHLDMDGVISDFTKSFKALSGGLTGDEYRKIHGRKGETSLFLTQGLKFWTEMDWAPGGQEVVNFALDNFNLVRILSSAGTGKNWDRFKEVQQGKLTWLANHLPQIPRKNIIIVPFASLKARHAGPDRILVDDKDSTINQWVLKGGIGILHHESQWRKTIAELQNHIKIDIGGAVNLREIVDSL